MYSVYRCENGRQTLVAANITDLAQALAQAKEYQSQVSSTGVQYRVRGPARDQRGIQKGSAFHSIVWYVPDSAADSSTSARDSAANVSVVPVQSAARPASPPKAIAAQVPDAPPRKKTPVYSITRIRGAIRTQAATGFLTLDAACERALELQRRDPDHEAQYIVLPPREHEETAPRAPRPAHSPPTAPKAASRASAARPRQDRSTNRPSAPSKAPPVTMVEERVYSVVSHTLGRKRVLVSNIHSRAEADASARDLRLRSRDSAEVILVQVEVRLITVVPEPQHPVRRTRSVVATMNRPHVESPSASKRGRRQRFDPEIDDRNGDISLATRAEDELGLGIPAQWGKGRRHRKGEYIP